MMEKLKKQIRFHSVKKMILWLLLAGIIITVMYVNSIHIKSLTSYCRIEKESDVNRCFHENPYVEVHTSKVYDAEYDYLYNKKKVARFVDVDINGYSMITLMTPEKATKLFEDESGNIVIRGKLEKFDHDAKLKGYRAIQERYVTLFKEEATREEVLNNFTLVQFNEYRGSKTTLYIFTTLGLGATLFFLFLAFKELKYVVHPEEYHLNQNISLKEETKVEKIIKELENGQYDFQKKNIYLTKNYLIDKFGGMQVAERKNVAWIYEKITKQNGITSGKSWLVYSTDCKTPFHFAGFGKNHQELGEVLKEQFPHATFGYSNELAKQWNKNKEQFLKNNHVEK